jgi:hypothetical protein
MTHLLGPSYFITEGHVEKLYQRATQQGIDADLAQRETDPSQTMEGLYIYSLRLPLSGDCGR